MKDQMKKTFSLSAPSNFLKSTAINLNNFSQKLKLKPTIVRNKVTKFTFIVQF